jgi:hypothetical protein
LVPVYATKTWKELAVDPELVTHSIPVQLEGEDLPILKENECEGVVLEVVDADQLWTLRAKRPLMFKHKNPRFQEMATGRSIEDIFQPKEKKKTDSDNILPYICLNRVENYMTKLSLEEQQDRTKIGQHIVGVLQDAANEYGRDSGVQLDAKQTKSLGKNLGRNVRLLIEQWNQKLI